MTVVRANSTSRADTCRQNDASTSKAQRQPSSRAKSIRRSQADAFSKESNKVSSIRRLGALLDSEGPTQAVSAQTSATSSGEKPSQPAYPFGRSGNADQMAKGNRLTAEQRQQIRSIFIKDPTRGNASIARDFPVSSSRISILRRQFKETGNVDVGVMGSRLADEQRQEILNIFVRYPEKDNRSIAHDFSVGEKTIWGLRRQLRLTGKLDPGFKGTRLTAEQRQDIMGVFINAPARSNASIARDFPVSEKTIGNLRKRYELSRNIDPRFGKYHLTVEQRQQLACIFANEPSKSNASIAREFGVSPGTILYLRRQFNETGDIGFKQEDTRLTAVQQQEISNVFVKEPTRTIASIASEFGVSCWNVWKLRGKSNKPGNAARRGKGSHLAANREQESGCALADGSETTPGDESANPSTHASDESEPARTDGRSNTTAHNPRVHERTALNAGIVAAEGKPNEAAHRQRPLQRAARSRTDAIESHPSGTSDGSVNAAGYRRKDGREHPAGEAGILLSADDRAFQGKQGASLETLDVGQRIAGVGPEPREDAQASVTFSRKRRAAKDPKEPGPKRQKDKAVKQEPAFLDAAFPAPIAGVEAARINTAQLSHVPTTSYAMIDLTAGDGSAMTVFTVRHTDEAIVSTGKQTYDPAMDKVFPIRAPAHPEQVHPDYADPDDPSRCAPHVALEGIRFYVGGACPNEQNLWRRARDNFEGDLPYTSKELFIEALKRSCEEELRATLQGRQPPSSQRVRIDVITDASQCDSPEEFAALRNQYGGFLTDYAPPSQPSLRNARIVCLFAGSRLASAEESQQYLDQLGAGFGWKALHDYGANAKQYGKHDEIAWAPFGGGNMGQYFNSTFKSGKEGKLQVDVDKTNAFLCPVIVDLKDRHGKARRESLLMVIQDRLIAEGKQIKLDYGDNYTLEAKESAPRMPIRPVKQESLERQADVGSSTSAAGQIGPWEPPRGQIQ